MNLLRLLLVCAFALALLVPTAEAAKPKKKKAITESGVVLAVNEDKDNKGEGSLTVKVTGGKKKKNAPANPEGVEKKFTFTKDTKVVQVTGKKKNAVETEASSGDLKAGSHVTIVTGADGKVEKISISAGKKKKS